MELFITALFLAVPTLGQLNYQRTPYEDSCMHQYLGQPSITGYAGPSDTYYNSLNGQTRNTYQVFSDLRKTTDKQLSLQSIGTAFEIDYLFNVYQNYYKQLPSYTPWTVSSINYDEQFNNWMDADKTIDKFAGFKFATAFQGDNDQVDQAQYHGFKLNSATNAYTKSTDASFPKNVREVSFVYQIEEILQKDQIINTDTVYPKTGANQKKYWGKYVQNFPGSKTTETIYLDEKMFRIIQVTFKGDTTLTIGSTSDARTPATFTYELNDNDEFLGVTSYFTTLVQIFDSQGSYQDIKTNVVGWLGLVVVDTACVKQLYCPSVPRLQVDQFNSDCDRVTLTWFNNGAATGSYKIEYGSRYEYSQTVSASAGKLVIDSNISSGRMQFRLSLTSGLDYCTGGSDTVYYDVPSCLPTAPINVQTQTGGTCDSASAQITVSWFPPTLTGGAPITSYEVALSNSQFGNYQKYTGSDCGRIDTFRNQQSCVIAFSLLQSSPYNFGVGQQIWAKVTSINRKGRADATSSSAAVVNDGPQGVTQVQAVANTDGNGITVSWTYFNGGSNDYVFILKGKPQSSPRYLDVLTSINSRTTSVSLNNNNGDFECGTNYNFQVYVQQINPYCQSTFSPTANVLYGSAPTAPTCVKTEMNDDNDGVNVEWTAPTSSTCVYSSLSYQVRIRDSFNTFQFVRCGGVSGAITGNICSVSTADLKAAPFYLDDGDEVVAQVTAQTSSFGPSSPGMSIATTNVSGCGVAILKGCPDAPTNLDTEWKFSTTSSETPTELELTWDRPLSDGGSPITGYQVQGINRDDSTSTDFTIQNCIFDTANSLTCKISQTDLVRDLDNQKGNNLCFKVMAFNAEASSCAFSLEYCTRWLTCPGQVTDIQIDDSYTNWFQLNVEWNAPSDIGGAPIQYYEVEYKHDTADDSAYTEVTPNPLSISTSVNSLITNRFYNFRIKACNSPDCSSCPWKIGRVEYAPPNPPNNPNNLREVQRETCCDKMTFTWDAPAEDGGRVITAYLITYWLQNNKNQLWSITVDEPELLNDGTFTTSVIESMNVGDLNTLKYTLTQNVIAGETYMVSVSAVNEVAPSYASDAIQIMAICCPSAPGNLQSNTATSNNRNIGMKWDQAVSSCAPITKYEVLQRQQIDEDLDQWKWIVKQNTGVNTQYVYTGADHCEPYSFTVVAYNKKCASPASNLVRLVAADRPAQPTAPTCRFNDDTDNFSFFWSDSDASSGDCAPITSYDLQLRKSTSLTTTRDSDVWSTGGGSSDGTWGSWSSSSTSSWSTGVSSSSGLYNYQSVICSDPGSSACTLSVASLTGTMNLQWGNSICARVSASNDYGTSIYSPESTVCCKYAITLPCPTNLEVVSEDETGITLEFDAVPAHSSGDIFYRVMQKKTSDANWQVIENNLLLNRYTARNLQYGQDYEWKIQAFNEGGESTGCESISRTFQPRICPLAPSFLQAAGSTSSCGSDSFTLRWVAPTSRAVGSVSGPAVVSYTVYVARGRQNAFVSSSTASWTRVTTVSAPTTEVLITLTSVGTTYGDYTFYVTANNGDCDSDESQYFQYNFQNAPLPPTLTATSECRSQSINLRWSYGSTTSTLVSAYQISYRNSFDRSWVPLRTSISSSTNQLTVRDLNGTPLVQGQTYSFKISATTASCAGRESTEQTVTLASGPNAPTSTYLSFNERNNQACLTWSAPYYDSSVSITGYKVEYHTGNNNFVEATCGSGQTSFGSTQCCFNVFSSFSGSSCQTVQARVSAISTCGNSQPSSVASQSSTTTPGRVFNVKSSCASGFDSRGSNQIQLSWAAPTDSGCDTVTSYKIEYQHHTCGSTYSSGSYSLVADNVRGTTYSVSYFPTGAFVQPNDEYTFVVSACNLNGCGVQSEAFTTSTSSTPATPLYAQATSAGQDMIRLSWSNPSSGWTNINGFQVQVSSTSSGFGVVNNVNCYTASYSENRCLVMLSELRQSPLNIGNGQSFTMQVIALGTSCNSAPSNTVNYQMSNDCQTGSTCQFRNVFIAPVDTSSASDEPIPQGNDDLPVDLGLDKQASNDENASADNSDSSDDSDSINLKAKNVESGFISHEETNESEQPQNFGLGVFTGIAVTLVLVAFVAVGFFLYSKKASNQKTSEARIAEREESENSSRRLSVKHPNETVPAEEEDFSETIKNLNGNPFADQQITDQNKMAREVQA